MKKCPLQVVALLLMFFLFSHNLQFAVVAQEPAAPAAQEKTQTESPEERKLREREESLKKKEEDRKGKELKARATEAKKYQTLSEFAEDLYASDPEFRDQVDDAYMHLQVDQAEEAHLINTLRKNEAVATENPGELMKLRRVLYDNPRVTEYVNRLGQQIVPEDSDKLYSFKIVVSPIPYGYTLSTGTVLISTGMISLLDNEAQLAYVLAHELAHVYKDHWRIKVMMPLAENEYNKKQERKRALWTGILTIAGGGLGAAIAGDKGAAIGLVSGFTAGYAVSNYYSKNIALDWNWAQENEADDFALKAVLGKNFDIQEVPRLYATMAKDARVDNRMQLGFMGLRSRIKERSEYAEKLINGALAQPYKEALQANKLKGTSPEFNQIMSELKRDNGIEAFYYDMFQMAKKNLQQAFALRSDDPVVAYYYGRVLKEVGRTKEELDLAQQSLLKAVMLDTRHEIPEVQLHRALMLMDAKDGNNNAEAIAALKAYIVAYEHKRADNLTGNRLLPPNVDVLYGYLRTLGDKNWIAPNLADLIRPGLDNPNNAILQPQTSTPRVEPASQTLSSGEATKIRKP